MDKFVKPGVLSQNTIELKKQKTKRMSPWAVASAIWSKDHVSADDITASGVSPYIIYTVAAQYNSAPLAYQCMQRLGANIDSKTLFDLFVDIMPWEWPVITPRGGSAQKLPADIIKIAAFNKVGLNTVREWLFYNIFNGDMAFIGPRPIVQNEFDLYCRVIKDAHKRHCVLPGLTGLSQVLIDENESINSFYERCRLDIEYARLTDTERFRTDIFIILKTIEQILLMGGNRG